MNNLNSILIEGNLVKDPVLRTTVKGTHVCQMCIASNRFYKQDTGFEKEVSYFFVDAWGRLGELCNTKAKKGRGVRVVGRLKQDRWTGTDGKIQSKIIIVAEHVEFRPEFKKDTKTTTESAEAQIPYDESVSEEVYAEEESVMESVTF